jgi:hypothetical protein
MTKEAFTMKKESTSQRDRAITTVHALTSYSKYTKQKTAELKGEINSQLEFFSQ